MPETYKLANRGYTRFVNQQFAQTGVGLPDVQSYRHAASDMATHYSSHGFSYEANARDSTNYQHSSSPGVVMPIASPRSLYLGTHSHPSPLNTGGPFYEVALKPVDPMPRIEEYQRSRISSVSARVNCFYKFLTHATSIYQHLTFNLPFISTKIHHR